MTAEDSTTTTTGAGAAVSASARSPTRELVRRAMWRFAPAYGRRRVRQASERDRLRRLELEFERVSERHAEQIDRLEDLARDLVGSVASLRRDLARHDPPGGD
jgi:hypothetical protein